jgi:SAM-dependent methyltransferase
MPKQWFHDWFNSPYYHLLYSKRNVKEAEYFINNLLAKLNPAPGISLLDVACGRGRHSVYLNKKGYSVTGFDLSVANIAYAKQFENDTLQFFVHDMRSLHYTGGFNIALNLFTSFGYFDTDEEHIIALNNINRALKPGGLLVLDFFNSHKVISSLVDDCILTIKDIDFHITKKIEGHKIIKSIAFKDADKVYNFKEVVSLFDKNDLSQFFKLSGFEVMNQYGNYNLDKFDVETSDRLIFICKKANA